MYVCEDSRQTTPHIDQSLLNSNPFIYKCRFWLSQNSPSGLREEVGLREDRIRDATEHRVALLVQLCVLQKVEREHHLRGVSVRVRVRVRGLREVLGLGA